MYKYTKIKGVDWGGIFTSLQKDKNAMNMARYFVRRRKKKACSSQDSFAYNESLQQPTS